MGSSSVHTRSVFPQHGILVLGPGSGLIDKKIRNVAPVGARAVPRGRARVRARLRVLLGLGLGN